MGRRRLQNKKVNKSGRLDPDLVKNIENRINPKNINFSQFMELSAEVGYEIMDDKLFQKLDRKSKITRKPISEIIRESLNKSFLD